MTGQKLPDGGILFDETDDEREDDAIEAQSAPSDTATPDIDWDAGWKNESGLKGMDLIAEFVKHLPNSPGVYRMFNEDRKSTRLNSSHSRASRMPSSA